MPTGAGWPGAYLLGGTCSKKRAVCLSSIISHEPSSLGLACAANRSAQPLGVWPRQATRVVGSPLTRVGSMVRPELVTLPLTTAANAPLLH